MQQRPAVVPPGPAAADALRAEEAGGDRALVEVAGHRRPVHPRAAGVEGFPVGQRCQGHQVGGGVGGAGQAQHLAAAAGAVVAGLTVVAEALKRSPGGCGGLSLGCRRWGVACLLYLYAAELVILRVEPWLQPLLQVFGRLGGAPVGIGQIPTLGQIGWRFHQLQPAALLGEQSGQPRHRLAARCIGIGPERHRSPRQRTPVGLGDGVGAVDPADHHLLREESRRGIGCALTLHHQHRSVGTLAQARQAVEGPGRRPLT